jgi:hypothetical protein
MARLTPFPGQIVGVDLSRGRRIGAKESGYTSAAAASLPAGAGTLPERGE